MSYIIPSLGAISGSIVAARPHEPKYGIRHDHSDNKHPRTFYLTLAGFVLFVVALLVTVLVEVPIVKQIVTWTAGTLPGNWQQLRDRWGSFHIIRVVAGVGGLALLVGGAIF